MLCCIYTSDEMVVAQALKSLHELSLLAIGLDDFLGKELLSLVVMSVCDSLLFSHSQFSRQAQNLALQLLLDLFRRYVYELSMPALIRVCEACFFIRQKERKNTIAGHITDYLLVEMQQSVRHHITSECIALDSDKSSAETYGSL